MTNQSNEPGRHRPERTGTAPAPVSSGSRAHGGGTVLAGQINARAWRQAADAARADATFRQDYRSRRADARALRARNGG